MFGVVVVLSLDMFLWRLLIDVAEATCDAGEAAEAFGAADSISMDFESGETAEVVPAGRPEKRAKKEPKPVDAQALAQKAIKKAEASVSKDSIFKELVKKIGQATGVQTELEAVPFSADLVKVVQKHVADMADLHKQLTSMDLSGEAALRTAFAEASEVAAEWKKIEDIAIGRIKNHKASTSGSKSSGKRKAAE